MVAVFWLPCKIEVAFWSVVANLRPAMLAQKLAHDLLLPSCFLQSVA